ncbi:LptE family protein [Acidipila rosea]|uniref:Outer membrane lipopolysaccharide assembly protein LptE/RlpB n=1 Tax=Acidipila rosea TaxID=768535 RepID=A0A4V2PUT2_9BACT|nr:LptE family protein [Acidipila rosea]MBW4027436.1 LptE family protein [Acidobacteriota bacterium]MBW4045615.1 LptE family protein [Acidobacteriota bacterium]TCK71701.1 outer membrane lipopolysaccharide assembly protein LptE/RlpB [Acidipila rosea]
MRRIFPASLLLFPALLAGCGYHAVESAVHLPKTVHTLAVDPFVNHTQSYHTEVDFTQAVVREFNSRTSLRVVPDKAPAAVADATLHGDINTFEIIPLTYNAQTGQSSSYLISIGASVRLVDRHGKLLYQNKRYLFRQQYETTQDPVSFIQEDPAAVERLARDFAQALVSDILESF